MTYEKYGMVYDCYHCKRETEQDIKQCSNNAYTRSIDECQWKTVINNDLIKIANGNKMLTFPALEEIIKNKSIEREEK